MKGTCAIIPVKSLTRAKTRLAHVLPPPARARLVLTMLTHVLSALDAVGEIDEVLVVTPDADVASLATKHRARILQEHRARGLNAAVRSGLDAAHHDGKTRALVLPADLPFAKSEEIVALLTGDAGPGRAQVTLVPAADGEGTNAMLLAPPNGLTPHFGPGSFLTHLSQALAHRLDLRVLHLASLAADIDQPADLALLRDHPEYAFLAEHISAGNIDTVQRA